MLCKEVIKIIEKAYPREYAMDWDNVGLLVGSGDWEVKKIYLALDATDEVINDAIAHQADLLITHHPMIFSPMKRITDENFISNRVIKLIGNHISYYAMHTNYDVLGMMDACAKQLNQKVDQVLEVTCQESPVDGTAKGIGGIYELEQPVSLETYGKVIKERFSLDAVSIFGDLGSSVKKIAVCPGSGKSTIPEAIRAGADVLVTGDIDHHSGIDAVDQGLAIIDAGHYGLEQVFVQDMKEYLEKNVECAEVIVASAGSPFQVV